MYSQLLQLCSRLLAATFTLIDASIFFGQVAWYLKFVVCVPFLVSLSVQTWNIFEKIDGANTLVVISRLLSWKPSAQSKQFGFIFAVIFQL